MPKVVKIGLSPSTIQLFRSCPQKFIFSVFADREERELNVENPSAAEWGTIFHGHLERHYTGQPYTPSGNGAIDLRFQEYVDHYGPESFPGAHFETSLSRPLTDVIDLIGTPDMVTDTALWDHKTVGAFKQNDYQYYANRDQFPQYLWLLGRDSGSQVIINQINRSAYVADKKFMSPQEFAEKVFRRIEIDVDEAQMNDWRHRVELVAVDIVRTIEAGTAWERKVTDSCMDFGGCFHLTQCRYRLYEPRDGIRSIRNKHFYVDIAG